MSLIKQVITISKGGGIQLVQWRFFIGTGHHRIKALHNAVNPSDLLISIVAIITIGNQIMDR
ncbi:hypothetical protein D3C86_1481860 [compost metagenome]